METRKIVNLLGDADNESSKFATRKWYVIIDQNNTDYGEGNESGLAIKFESKIIKSNLCDYSDAYLLVTGDIIATGTNANNRVVFKNCYPFTKYITHRNDEHVDGAENLGIIMPMYNLMGYNDNYSDTSGSLWQFKRDESPVADGGNPDSVCKNNSKSFKYKASFIEKSTAVDGIRVFKNVKIAVPLKYLSNFWRSLEMTLINCKIDLELDWTNDCVMSAIADTKFKITNTNVYFPIVTLLSKDIVKLVKLLEEGFKRRVYWNEYQTKIKSRNLDNTNLTRFLIDASFQVVRRLFVLAFDNTDNDAKKFERNSHRKYFLQRLNITNYNVVLINGRNFHDQPINDLANSTTRLERLQQDKEMITKQDVCYIISTSKIITI